MQLLRNRASLRSLREEPGTPDADACQTSTQRRKVSEEYLEADFTEHGAGRVTGKGWWPGVEPGDRGQWDMSLLIPVSDTQSDKGWLLIQSVSRACSRFGGLA